jgi:hypothetical protein
MDIFYIIVLGIALVLLIIILAFVGIGMRNRGSGEVWPPTESTCPDYWSIDKTNPDYCLIPTIGNRNVGTIYNNNKNLAYHFDQLLLLFLISLL